ncbi:MULTISPECIES: FAD-dependent monooxygenase [Gammaproteobacteria]|uniref:FAD-dependent monooxygenase n=1 Tax=Gammaproteobacteria TaxID=1236 RepID=UPI0019123792|nr:MULTISPECIES: FAD-dependent monooxygenase [Gammaproteobacteria]MBK5304585.1 FAD-dependent monooxygenase [Bacillus sp. TH86]MBK5324354.1 FAD-dependent monooxygenase [Bacillus sp. TH59]MBK5339304.1 FAD-dependent monooxygenase [Bacillus sp. TH57]MBK5313352.1 FAD-dependent monooxygenase [Pseudomonas sp. TH71]MBK5318851.1 FAD-dependent monooxygenase [Erwinia sp. TH79]
MNRSDVLIIGAGPTGLVLALWLSKLGIAVRIIDKTSTPGTTSRALAVQARTLELYSQLDLSDAVVQNGHKVAAANFWVKGEAVARLPLSTIGEGLTPYAFLEIYPQDEHERLLIERLEAFGITVERNTELQSFEETSDGITARLRLPDGQQETCQACYLAGCDGARSIVRKTLDTGFPGGTYQQIFYVADVQARGPTFNGELHVDLDEADFLAVFPLSNEGRARLIGTVRDERAERAETLQFEDVSSRAIENLKLQIDQVNWFSTYRVHHRVADHFRTGRAFLLGDAAHVHSPAGGQGMNTGIGDAINLAWKLATVLSGGATPKLLDSYETERIAFARRLVATTDRVFSFVTADGPIADLVRMRVAPFLIPKMISFEAAREFMFRTVSQTTLNYRGMPLSEGVAGHVHGGDRLPWAHDGEGDNFESLKNPTWQVHVYGETSDEMIAWCTEHHLPLQVFDWRPVFETVGLARNGFYLLRPDTYVAIADYSADPKVIERYFRDREIRLFFG